MKTVLIVDDSAFMRNLIKKHLSEIDVRVVGEAEDGKAAVEKYVDLKPDIVTLDLAMFEVGGIEALEEIMNHDPKAKVIIVSSTTKQDSVVSEVMALGACTVIDKPIVKEDLLGAFEEVIPFRLKKPPLFYFP